MRKNLMSNKYVKTKIHDTLDVYIYTTTTRRIIFAQFYFHVHNICKNFTMYQHQQYNYVYNTTITIIIANILVCIYLYICVCERARACMHMRVIHRFG